MSSLLKSLGPVGHFSPIRMFPAQCPENSIFTSLALPTFHGTLLWEVCSNIRSPRPMTLLPSSSPKINNFHTLLSFRKSTPPHALFLCSECLPSPPHERGEFPMYLQHPASRAPSIRSWGNEARENESIQARHACKGANRTRAFPKINPVFESIGPGKGAGPHEWVCEGPDRA